MRINRHNKLVRAIRKIAKQNSKEKAKAAAIAAHQYEMSKKVNCKC